MVTELTPTRASVSEAGYKILSRAFGPAYASGPVTQVCVFQLQAASKINFHLKFHNCRSEANTVTVRDLSRGGLPRYRCTAGPGRLQVPSHARVVTRWGPARAAGGLGP